MGRGAIGGRSQKDVVVYCISWVVEQGWRPGSERGRLGGWFVLSS